MTLKSDILEQVKACMRAGDKPKLAALRLITAGIKQREVDERIELDDEQVIGLLAKMVKERRDAIEKFQQADRQDLVAQEQFEITVIETFLPAQLSEAEITAEITAAIEATGATSMRDMGKVMAILKSKLQGRADMGAVSKLIKAQLG